MQQWKKRGTYHSVLEAIQEMSGLTEEELLSPSHIEPNRIQNIPEAAECIRACAITQGMPVVIVGDYDADGITSTGHSGQAAPPFWRAYKDHHSKTLYRWVRYLGVSDSRHNKFSHYHH